MFLTIDSSTSAPLKIGNVGDGSVIVQVLNGAGVWVGKTDTGLMSARVEALALYDGFLVDPSLGIVEIRWSGDIYIWWPDRLTTVHVEIDYAGCSD